MNVLWHSLVGKPVPEIVVGLKETPVVLPGESGPRRAAEVFGDDNPWFEFQATNLHGLDPGMLGTVLAGPEILLEGYDPDKLLPAIRCPVLLLQGDPAAGGLLSDGGVERGTSLLTSATHVRLHGIGHELHGPPGQEQHVLRAIAPFLERVQRGGAGELS